MIDLFGWILLMVVYVDFLICILLVVLGMFCEMIILVGLFVFGDIIVLVVSIGVENVL